MRYLLESYEHQNWPLIHAGCNDAPHASWWTYRGNWSCVGMDDSGVPDLIANPGAEILGYLFQHDGGPPSGFIQTIMDPALNRLSAPLEMHDLQCYVRLFESPSLPGAARDAMLPLLLAHACDLVRIAAPDWDEYALMPLHVISGPDSMFMGFFGEAVAANFEWLSAQQCTDGSWAPSWSWGGSFPSTWEVVEYEIRATLTLDVLQKLKQFSRL